MVSTTQTDALYRGTFLEGKIRYSIVQATQVCNDGVLTHNTDPVSGFYFSQALIATLLTVPLMKGEQSTTIRWEYEGVLKKILSEVTSESKIRALPYAPQMIDLVSNENDIFGEKGSINVMRSDTGTGKVLSQGTIPAGLMDVVDDLGYFFSLSDQVETELIASVLFNADPDIPVRLGRGVMIQSMPDMDLEAFGVIREKLRTEAMRKSLTQFEHLTQESIQAFFAPIAEGTAVEVHDCPVPQYFCHCERNRMIASVRTLARTDLDHIFENQDAIDLECQFCRKKYKITKEECEG